MKGKYSIQTERGMKKWAAFQSITQQFEGIRQILSDQKKVERPILNEDKIEDINQALVAAYNHKSEISITFYDDGFFKTYRGHLKNIDTIFKFLEIIITEGERKAIPYTDIIEIN